MKKSFIILLHIGYWLLYLLLISLFILFLEVGRPKTTPQNEVYIFDIIKTFGFFTIMPALIGFYSFYNLLFNNYLRTKKFGLLFLWSMASIITAGIISYFCLGLANKGFNGNFREILMVTFILALLALIHGIIALVMKGFISWYGDIKVKEELEKKNYETELALVKSQLNPHFLFNTINNIDVLIEKDAPKASLYLNKLSDMMRFMLYETKTDKIPLTKELAYVEKYIELQKIRSINPNYISYNFTGNFNNWLIEPMLFIPFIENAFKHTLNKNENNLIIINIKALENSLSFYCQNQLIKAYQTNNNEGGLGKELIQKRLDLLYKNNYALNISNLDNKYIVQLTINKQ